MQTPSAVAHAARLLFFDTLTYGVAYVLGAFMFLSQADFWLILPLLVWLGLYSFLIRWTVKKVSLASKTASNARSALNGRVIDGYTNIYLVKMFAHEKTKLDYVKDDIEPTCRTIISLLRLETKMQIVLWLLNGFLIVAVIGGALILWMGDDIAVGAVVAATMLVFRLDAMSAWIIGVITISFRNLG
jgi:ATP-binding cassette subfamily B multidrug efflux pump